MSSSSRRSLAVVMLVAFTGGLGLGVGMMIAQPGSVIGHSYAADAPPAALANAIYRAIGVRLRELPMSPGRVFRAKQQPKK